jgi:predicted amino acid dehydrogenase
MKNELIRSETFHRSCFIITRVKGRVIRFEYVKDQLTPEELESQREQELNELVEGNKVVFLIKTIVDTLFIL